MLKSILSIPDLFQRCVGCSACAKVCSVKCIAIEDDIHGFFRPVIQRESCRNCGVCLNVCPLQCKKNVVECNRTYAVQANDAELRQSSSSGGVFSLLAVPVIAQNGVVFGAAFTEDFHVEHRACQTLEELRALRCSKYVQSNLKNTFVEAREMLQQNRYVLYSGTPCQIAALKSFLGKDYPKLLTCAVRCYGVPSPLIWEKYLQFRSKQADNSKIQSVCFRYKYPSWQDYSVKIDFADNSEAYIKRFYRDDYMRLFLQRISLRSCCDRCEFRKEQGNADIILGDFWEIDHCLDNWNDGKGTSIVTVLSSRGQEFLNAINGKCRFQSVVEPESNTQNKLPDFLLRWKRKQFFRRLDEYPFDKVTERVLRRGLLERALEWFLRKIRG